MDFVTGRPDHIEDYLITLHSGQWFGWSDSKNKVYANLVIHPEIWSGGKDGKICLLYTSPSPRDGLLSRMPSSA